MSENTLNMSQTEAGKQTPKFETFWQLVWRRFRKHRLAVWSSLSLLALLGISYGVPLLAPLFGARRGTP